MEVIRSLQPEVDAGRALTALLEENQRNPILLLLSGGSGFSILQYVDTSIFNKSITIGVLDERYSTDATINNFLQLCKTDFYKSVKKRGVDTIDTSISYGASCTEVSDIFEKSLKAWVNKNRNGKVIVTMGLGTDGHTAGILPNISYEDFSSEGWVVSYSVSKDINEYTDRITTTYTFLKNIVDEAVVFAVGKEKQKIIQKLSLEDCDLVSMPACVMHAMSSVKLYTDDM